MIVWRRGHRSCAHAKLTYGISLSRRSPFTTCLQMPMKARGAPFDRGKAAARAETGGRCCDRHTLPHELLHAHNPPGWFCDLPGVPFLLLPHPAHLTPSPNLVAGRSLLNFWDIAALLVYLMNTSDGAPPLLHVAQMLPPIHTTHTRHNCHHQRHPPLPRARTLPGAWHT